MLRHTFLLLLAVAVTGGVSFADNNTAADSAKGKTHRINFDRRYKAGQRFLLTAKATRSKQIPKPSPKVPNSSKKDKKTSPKQQDKAAVDVRGELEILKVNRDHKPTKIRLTVHRFKGTWKETGDGSSKLELRKGDVLIATSGKPDLQKFNVQGRDVEISKDVAEVIDAILPLDDENKPDLNDPLKGTQERKVGESWKLNVKSLPGEFKKADSINAAAKFIGVKTVAGRKAANVKVHVHMKGIKGNDSVKSGKMTLTTSAWLALDSQALPPLKIDGSVKVIAQLKSKAANVLNTSELTITQRVQRELKPLD